MRHTWYGAQVNSAMEMRWARNLSRSGVTLIDYWRTLIGIVGPPRSLPGMPPHIDTQQLFDSLDHVTNAATLTESSGSDVPWSVYMELGTNTVAPRPWARRGCIEKADDIAKELAS